LSNTPPARAAEFPRRPAPRFTPPAARRFFRADLEKLGLKKFFQKISKFLLTACRFLYFLFSDFKKSLTV